MASKRLKFDKKEITEIADTLNQSTQSLINLLAKQSEISPGAVPNVSQSSDQDILSDDNIATLRKAKELRLHVLGASTSKPGVKRKRSSLTVSFCKMERSRKRGLKKCDDYVEVNLTGEENYDLCVQKAVTSLGIEYETDDYTPCIVRLSGCKVLNQPVHIDGKELAWTISRYARSVFQKSTHSVKLGIALLQRESEVEETIPKKKVKYCDKIQVWYAPNLGECGLDSQDMKTRDEAWQALNDASRPCMNQPIPWYPESAGYEVCKIKKGETDLLTYDENTEGFKVHKDRDRFCIIHQSEDTTIHTGDVVQIFCVAAMHSCNYQYSWDNLNGVVGLISPVLYVNKEGVYRCMVTKTVGGTSSRCYSKSICVNEASAVNTNTSDTSTSSSPDQIPMYGHSSNSVDPSQASGIAPTSQPSLQPSDNLKTVATHTVSNPVNNPVIPPAPASDSCIVRNFTEYEIKIATSSFNDLIGSGGFGKVYRGSFHGLDIAVKVFSDQHEESAQTSSLDTEVSNLSRFRHPNLITLMGYCRSMKALVYPYMENLSLWHCLHRFKVEDPLSWERRIHILYGTACGIMYLHSYNPPFIHQDIKSHNVLLDKSFSPKVCDFGFVTAIENIGSTGVVTAVGNISLAGTRGYTALEYTDGRRGPKTDVYMYGVLCLETYTGLLPYSEEREEEKLVDHCQEEDMWKDVTKFRAMADLKAGLPSEVLASTILNISQECLKTNHKKRCTMDKVLAMWSGVIQPA